MRSDYMAIAGSRRLVQERLHSVLLIQTRTTVRETCIIIFLADILRDNEEQVSFRLKVSPNCPFIPESGHETRTVVSLD